MVLMFEDATLPQVEIYFFKRSTGGGPPPNVEAVEFDGVGNLAINPIIERGSGRSWRRSTKLLVDPPKHAFEREVGLRRG
jgi:hypothetical protein